MEKEELIEKYCYYAMRQPYAGNTKESKKLALNELQYENQILQHPHKHQILDEILEKDNKAILYSAAIVCLKINYRADECRKIVYETANLNDFYLASSVLLVKKFVCDEYYHMVWKDIVDFNRNTDAIFKKLEYKELLAFLSDYTKAIKCDYKVLADFCRRQKDVMQNFLAIFLSLENNYKYDEAAQLLNEIASSGNNYGLKVTKCAEDMLSHYRIGLQDRVFKSNINMD